jgi:hypothetical protein
MEIEDASVADYVISRVLRCRWSEDDMFRRSKEYSLEELLEHPVLGVQMTSEGIERRCLDLMFDATSGQHRFAEGEFGERSAGPFAP